MSVAYVLYRLYGEGDQLLYVGRTTNPSQRFTHHRSMKEWWASVVKIQLEHFADLPALVLAERNAIRTERPVYNIALATITRDDPGAWPPCPVPEPSPAPEVEAAVTDPEAVALLADVRTAWEGRELWRGVAPLLRRLQALGVTFREIQRGTGVSPATAHRAMATWRLSATTPNT